MNNSYVEQILKNKLKGKIIQTNEYFKLSIDYVLGHDATFSLIIDDIEKLNLPLFNRNSLFLFADHFSTPATIERASILNKFIDYTQKNKLLNVYLFEGICHQVMVEHPDIIPGLVIIGADSHTVTASALGCLAFGLGSYDILYSLITGHTVFKFKGIKKIILMGTIPNNITGKDIILHTIHQVGEDGGNEIIWEIEDKTNNKLSQDDRFAFSNMCIEAGAISATFVPDEITYDYLMKMQKNINYRIPYYSNLNNQSEFLLEEPLVIDVTSLKPQIAKPHSPANVVDIDDVLGVKITQVYIGSCSSGRLSDIEAVAEIVKNRKVKPFVKAILIPSSRKIYMEAISRGYIKTILEAGFIVEYPSCGPCGRIDKGVIGPEDICLSTSNRNYVGRMGSSKAQIYLASAKVAAISALKGEICCP